MISVNAELKQLVFGLATMFVKSFSCLHRNKAAAVKERTLFTSLHDLVTVIAN